MATIQAAWHSAPIVHEAFSALASRLSNEPADMNYRTAEVSGILSRWEPKDLRTMEVSDAGKEVAGIGSARSGGR